MLVTREQTPQAREIKRNRIYIKGIYKRQVLAVQKKVFQFSVAPSGGCNWGSGGISAFTFYPATDRPNRSHTPLLRITRRHPQWINVDTARQIHPPDVVPVYVGHVHSFCGRHIVFNGNVQDGCGLLVRVALRYCILQANLVSELRYLGFLQCFLQLTL